MDFRYWVHHGWDVVDGSSPPSLPYRRSHPGEHPPYVRECPPSGFPSNWIMVCTSIDLCLGLCLTGNVVSSRGSSPPLPPLVGHVLLGLWLLHLHGRPAT